MGRDQETGIRNQGHYDERISRVFGLREKSGEPRQLSPDASLATQYPPSWVGPYIGIPFVDLGRDRDGADCWGLARLAAKERFGFDLPSYAGEYASTADVEEIRRLVAREKPLWRSLQEDTEAEGDFLNIRMRGNPLHFALVVAPGWMLHTEEGIESVCERYGDRRWARRIIGAYRWEAVV